MKRRGEEPDPAQLEQIQREVGEYFEATASPFHLTSELRDDGLIDPTDTRNTLGMAFSAALNAPIVRTPGGVLRI
jgi:3-methylcrotonyl-CoA carboxylase beta subunit